MKVAAIPTQTSPEDPGAAARQAAVSGAHRQLQKPVRGPRCTPARSDLEAPHPPSRETFSGSPSRSFNSGTRTRSPITVHASTA